MEANRVGRVMRGKIDRRGRALDGGKIKMSADRVVREGKAGAGHHGVQRNTNDGGLRGRAPAATVEDIRGDIQKIIADGHVREVKPATVGLAQHLGREIIKAPVGARDAGRANRPAEAHDVVSQGVGIPLAQPEEHIARRVIDSNLVAAEFRKIRIGIDVGKSAAVVGGDSSWLVFVLRWEASWIIE